VTRRLASLGSLAFALAAALVADAQPSRAAPAVLTIDGKTQKEWLAEFDRKPGRKETEDETNRRVSVAAVALSNFGPTYEDSIKALANGSADKSDAKRHAAIRALAEMMGGCERAAKPLLDAALSDKEPLDIRLSALASISDMTADGLKAHAKRVDKLATHAETAVDDLKLAIARAIAAAGEHASADATSYAASALCERAIGEAGRL
jgi:hypothetical protein